MHSWLFDPVTGPHLNFSWLWPLMIVFFSLGGWRRFAGGYPRHGHSRPPSLPPAQPTDPALETLRQRFARGEIGRAEYEERRTALLARPSVLPPQGRAAESAGKRGEPRNEWPDLS
jgi:hypothetical protein